jgi:hypothetical protein
MVELLQDMHGNIALCAYLTVVKSKFDLNRAVLLSTGYRNKTPPLSTKMERS